MRVTVDGELAAQLHGPPRIHVIQVQPGRVGVDLHHGAGLDACLQHPLYIQFRRRSRTQQPARGMAEDVDMRIIHGFQTASGDGFAILPLGAVDAGHSHVQSLQYLVGQTQRAVGQDLHFAPLQQPEIDPLRRKVLD